MTRTSREGRYADEHGNPSAVRTSDVEEVTQERYGSELGLDEDTMLGTWSG